MFDFICSSLTLYAIKGFRDESEAEEPDDRLPGGHNLHPHVAAL